MSDLYLAIFDFLNRYWQRTQNDELGSLLGDMSPYLWGDDLIPIDQAIVANWEEIAGSKGKVDVTEEVGFKFMVDFLIVQSNVFNISDLINDLKSALVTTNELWDMWELCYKSV